MAIDKQELFQNDSSKLGQKINPVPRPETNIGIDTQDIFYDNIIEAGEANAIDIGQLSSLTQISNNRETMYQVLDTMSEDSTIAAMLEVYTEDATETNDQGQIVWAESSDSKVSQYVEYLLKSLNVDKNIFQWTHSLIKYGDIYLKLFHQSDFEDDLFEHDENKTPLNEEFNKLQDESLNNDSKTLNEDVVVRAYSQDDKLVNYIELVPNPAEMFELTKFGKSFAYIRTNTVPTTLNNNQLVASSYYLYKFRRQDVQIYNAVSFVHGALQDDTPRIPEQIQIFKTDITADAEPYTYTVRRGQSILYNTYKIWRQMMLLENALLLNRITKSSILRVIGVEVADMPKERVAPHLQRIKQLVEQKSSITTGDNMSEYTNPGAMENNIYVPTHNGVGAISTQQIGGDVNVRDIADIDYFKTKLYASLRVPKQFIGDTDDATGFNGGTSLSIVSSRYAKTIKRIQATMCQVLTDAINILLIDRGLSTYVNKFVIRMQSPVTQEELDKRDNTSAKVGLSDDVLRMLDGIEDDVIKLKITKSLLSTAITNSEVIQLLQDYIDSLESEEEESSANNDSSTDSDDDFDFGGLDDFGSSGSSDSFDDIGNDVGDDMDFGDLDDIDSDMSSEESSLPTPEDLGVGDMSDML